MILVDTSVWIDLFNRHTTLQTAALTMMLADTGVDVGVGDLVLMEVLQGAKDDRRAALINQRLSVLPQITVSNPTIAVQAAQNYRTLRARGITIRKTIDTLIATRCIVDRYALLYSDRDFDPFVEHLDLQSAMA